VTSLYFEELLERYSDELDDLRWDSAGVDILNKRLGEKRSAFSELVPMMLHAPEMVACTLHGAFRFGDVVDLDAASQSEPGEPEFPAWDALQESLETAPWARPLIAICLEQDGGDEFLAMTAILEWLLSRNAPVRSATSQAVESDGDDDTQDLGEAGEEWLSAQGFDDLNR
jgi:hypothetical protein